MFDNGGGDEGDDDGVGVGDDGVGDGRQFIQCNETRFTDKTVKKCVKDIFNQCYDGDWVTFKKDPTKPGRANHKNDLCRRTGGSIRFDQYRINLDKEEGKTV
ncbi:hypothetical protein HanRHA438_Chr17g0794581 [Helianthus annuus]|nr:hypothetical protein HanRHA438_Chr17g0794581 [Helianthus annuus]